MQYASNDYQRILKNYNLTYWIIRGANCWDNAPVESFFATLKKELIYQPTKMTRALHVKVCSSTSKPFTTELGDTRLSTICSQSDLNKQTGLNRHGGDRGKPLAGKKPFELPGTAAPGRQLRQSKQKIAARHSELEQSFVEIFIEEHRTAPREIVLDLDATDVPVHSHQLGPFFQGYYREYCILPHYIFCGRYQPVEKLMIGRNLCATGSASVLSVAENEHWQSQWHTIRYLVRRFSTGCYPLPANSRLADT